MKKQLSLLATAFVLLLAACEKQVDIDLVAQDPEVVVRAMGDNQSPLQLRLTYSRPTFGTFYVPDTADYFPRISGASITLTVNGVSHSPASSTGGDYTFAYTPQPGDRLALSVNVPGHKTVNATAEVPQAPQISGTSVTLSDDYYYSIYNSTVRFTLNDRAATSDYYSVRLFLIDTAYYVQYDLDSNVVARDTAANSYYLDFSCTDYTVISNTGIDAIDTEDPDAGNTYIGDELLFTDANINGLSHQFTLQPPSSYGYNEYYYRGDDDHYFDYDPEHFWDRTDKYRLFLEVSTLTRDNYLYLQTVNAYDDDELLSLFGEPIQIHSNIDGGIGIFAIRSRVSIELPVND